jgi:hypothetical protein
MVDKVSPKVKEGWWGPGRMDGTISELKPIDDALHMDLSKKGMYEWWYFDAHLDGGYTVVAFFHASNPNPGTSGKSGVELTLLRPTGEKTHLFVEYPRSEFHTSKDKPEVEVGHNLMRVDYSTGGLPIYEIVLDEGDIGFHLTYSSEVKGWMPGNGCSQFGDMGYFAWVIPIPRATVTGVIRDGDEKIPVSGIGYHDHNWLDFAFQRIIEYWMWGRVYSENFTMSYAFIQCNKKVDNHAVKVLMLAKNENIILSSGEFELMRNDFEDNKKAGHKYPRSLTFKAGNLMETTMKVQKILEAENMLDNLSPLLRFGAKLLRMKPGYFRLLSDFTIKVFHDGLSYEESGTTLHEIVAFKPIR